MMRLLTTLLLALTLLGWAVLAVVARGMGA